MSTAWIKPNHKAQVIFQKTGFTRLLGDFLLSPDFLLDVVQILRINQHPPHLRK